MIGDDGIADERMTDDELLSFIESEEVDAQSYADTLSGAREKAISYYFTEKLGNEEDGRSQAMSSDVLDGIESMMPSHLKPFVTSDDVVKFLPTSAEDERACEQEAAYLNHVLMQKNDGFLILYQWLKDGLMQKNGVVKYFWDTIPKVALERYHHLNDDQLTMIAQDKNVEIMEHSPEDSGYGYMTHEVKLRIKSTYGCARVINIPPEEFRINSGAPDCNIKKARFVEHISMVSLSTLRQRGFEIADDIDGFDDGKITGSPEFMARHGSEFQDPDLRDSNRLVMVRETYPLVDWDNDGISERRCIVIVGKEILLNEEVEEIPFSSWTPYPVPHRFDGLCPADMLQDIQLQKTTLLRQNFDNVYGINNNRSLISNRVNLDDLIENPVGGYIRVDGEQVSNDMLPAPVTPLGQVILPFISYLDAAKQQRTGVTAYNQGTDADSLNKTATGITKIMDASQARSELVSRVFAETGFKDLMMSLHGLIRRNDFQQSTFKMGAQWVTIDPRNWVTREHMTVSVGLGTGDRQQTAMHMTQILQMQREALGAGLTSKPKIYHALRKFTEAIGFKDAEQFWDDPTGKPEPPQQPHPDVQKAQMEMQADAEKQKFMAQAEQGKEQFKAQQEQQKLQATHAFEMEKERLKAQHAEAMAQMKGEQDYQIALLKSETDKAIASASLQVDAEKFNVETEKFNVETGQAEQARADQIILDERHRAEDQALEQKNLADQREHEKQTQDKTNAAKQAEVHAAKPKSDPHIAKLAEHVAASVKATEKTHKIMLAPKKITKDVDGSQNVQTDYTPSSG